VREIEEISGMIGIKISASNVIETKGWNPIKDVIRKYAPINKYNSNKLSETIEKIASSNDMKLESDNISTKKPALKNIKKKFDNPIVLFLNCGIVNMRYRFNFLMNNAQIIEIGIIINTIENKNPLSSW